MKFFGFLFVSLLCMVNFGTALSAEIQSPPDSRLGPCCEITEIKEGGLVIARDIKTGRTIRVQIDDMSQMRRLRVGQPLYVDSDTGKVSLHENDPAESTRPSPDHGDFYVAGFAGFTSPNDFSSVTATGAGTGIGVSNLALQSSLMYGAKVGYFFPTINWLGVEAEVFNTNPNLKQQSVTFSVPGATASTVLPGADIRVLTTAFNVILRYPGAVFQPYAGIGLGVFFAEARDLGTLRGSVSDNWVPGLNALAGARFFLTKNIALFAEYKYNRATFTFDNVLLGAGLNGVYSANIFAGGVSFHF